MTVYKKLQEARFRLVNTTIQKSGKNKFAGFEYFELGDFIPAIQKIFNEVGLCGVVSFTDVATLTIYDADDGTSIPFCTPIVNAENAKGQPIQSLGATHTYLRRYLWLLALEIVEHDAIDGVELVEAPKKKAEVKPEAKPTPTLVALHLTDDQLLFIEKMKELGSVATTQTELSGLWKSNLVQLETIGRIDPNAHASVKEFFRQLKECQLKESLKGNK